MPQIDISSLHKKGDKAEPLIIDGEAQDMTGRQDLDEDTIDLTSEPEFKQEAVHDHVEDADTQPIAKLPYGPLRQLNISRLSSKWRMLEQLTATIPLNEYDLPTYIYRMDMLDHNLFYDVLNTYATTGLHDSATTTSDLPRGEQSMGIEDLNDYLQVAQITLDYHEGFPTLPNGVAFWDKMDFESKEAHDAFIFYLEQDGARKLTSLIAYNLDEVKKWFHCYYWSFRVKAFDLYKVAHANRLKLQRMLSTEDTHYRQASRMLTKLNAVFEGNEFGERLTQLDPDKLVGVLDKIVKIQRISIGLPANGGQIPDVVPMQTPTTQNITQNIVMNGANRDVATEDEYNLLEEDPDSVELAQQLIINSQKGNV